MKKDFGDELVHLYNFIKKELPEKVIDEIFGIDDLKFHISDMIEDLYKEYFISRKISTDKLEIFLYDDAYDFLNTISGIYPDDLYIFFTDRNIMIYVIDIIKSLNRIFNKWIQGRSSGYRKGSKIYLELFKNEEVKLIFKPDLNLK